MQKPTEKQCACSRPSSCCRVLPSTLCACNCPCTFLRTWSIRMNLHGCLARKLLVRRYAHKCICACTCESIRDPEFRTQKICAFISAAQCIQFFSRESISFVLSQRTRPQSSQKNNFTISPMRATVSTAAEICRYVGHPRPKRSLPVLASVWAKRGWEITRWGRC
jgi:hypothetical protein